MRRGPHPPSRCWGSGYFADGISVWSDGIGLRVTGPVPPPHPAADHSWRGRPSRRDRSPPHHKPVRQCCFIMKAGPPLALMVVVVVEAAPTAAAVVAVVMWWGGIPISVRVC